MKLFIMIISLFGVATKSEGNHDGVSKLNDAFEGNEKYWKPVIPQV